MDYSQLKRGGWVFTVEEPLLATALARALNGYWKYVQPASNPPVDHRHVSSDKFGWKPFADVLRDQLAVMRAAAATAAATPAAQAASAAAVPMSDVSDAAASDHKSILAKR